MKDINLVLNSEISIDELAKDDEIKGHHFISKFIEAGVAHYDNLGDVLITKETLNKIVPSIVGCPVIINHTDITPENVEQERVGVVSEVEYDQYSGWFVCSGVIWDKQAIGLIKNDGWNVSCAYKFKTSGEPVMYHGKQVDMEFIDGDFQHLAIVKTPRYEGAKIVVNSQDVENGGAGSGDFDHAGRPPEVGGSEPAGTGRKGKYKDGKQQWTGAKSESKEYKKEDKQKTDKPDSEKSGEGEEKLNIKTTTVKTKNGERKIEYVDNPPKGWVKDKNATTAPRGYDWYNNNKGLFSKDSKSILVKDKNYFDKEKQENTSKDSKQLRLFNGKDTVMTVLNELKSFVLDIVQNAKDDKRAGIDKVAGIMKSAGCDDEDIRTAIGIMEKVAYDKSEAGTADNKCAKNAKEDDKKEVKNEDKRKLIDEIGGILKGQKLDDEIIRTVIGKAEEIAYNPSEKDKADNCSKAKNEKEEIKEEIKEDKKEVKNSLDDVSNILYKGSQSTPESSYMTRAERLELGNKF